MAVRPYKKPSEKRQHQHQRPNQQVVDKDKLQQSGLCLQTFFVSRQSFFDQLHKRLCRVVSASSASSLKRELRDFLQEKHFCKDKTLSVTQFVWLLTQFEGPYERLEVLDIVFEIPFFSGRPQDYLLASVDLFSPVFLQIQAISKFSSLGDALDWIGDDSLLILFQKLEKKGFYVVDAFFLLAPLIKNISNIPLGEIVSLSETPIYKLAVLEAAQKAGYVFASSQSAGVSRVLEAVPDTHWIDFLAIFPELRPCSFEELVFFFVGRKVTASMQETLSHFLIHYLSSEQRQKCDTSGFLATFPKLKQKRKVLKVLRSACLCNPTCQRLYKKLKEKYQKNKKKRKTKTKERRTDKECFCTIVKRGLSNERQSETGNV